MNTLSLLCMRLARRLFGETEAQWFRAMEAELVFLNERERTSWAAGCFFAAVKRRFTMSERKESISRWVLSLELTMCFLPITFGWADATFGRSGVVRLSSDVVTRYFADRPWGMSILAMMIAGACVGVIGPIGMWFTLRAIGTGRGLKSRPFGVAMLSAITLFGLGSILLRAIAGPGAYAATPEFMILIVLLPAIGIVHLMHISSTPAERVMA